MRPVFCRRERGAVAGGVAAPNTTKPGLAFASARLHSSRVRTMGQILPRVLLAVKPGDSGALRSPVAAQAVSSPQVGAQRGKTESGAVATPRRSEPAQSDVTNASLAFGGGPSAERVRGAARRVHRQSQTEGTAASICARSPFLGCGRHGHLGLVGVRARVGQDPEIRPGVEAERATALRLP